MNDYDVVIGATISDQTAPGAAQVRGTAHKLSEDIRQYGDKQAREFGRTSREIFNQTDQHVTRSANSMVKRLTYMFDQNNFLLRNLARQAGFTWGSIGIGVGKLALSYGKLGKDTEDAAHRSKVALEDIASAVTRLSTDATAFPAALKATRDLSMAYEAMGKSGHAASVKAGSALEDIVHKRIVTLQGGLQKAQSHFEKLRINASKDTDILGNKINEVSASVRHLLGGVNVDAAFFKSFIKARNETEKYLLVLDKLGPRAAFAYSQNQVAVEKLSGVFARLERHSTKSIKSQSDRLSEAATKVTNYQTELSALEKELLAASTATNTLTESTVLLEGSMVVTSVIVAGVVIVILAAVVASIALAASMYKGATTAAAYGNEIYKLSLSTGLSVKTLSALSIIAKETNTDIDSLAKTFTRTQIQIQRGLDKPLSEAGRALRTLKVNFDELRKANPDQQIFTLAKAYTALNNQNVRATVSQQIFSRDAERQGKMLEQIAHGFTAAQEKAKKYGLELDEAGVVKANLATVAAQDLSLAWQGIWVNLGIKILPPLTILVEKFTEGILKSGSAFDIMGRIALTVLHEIRLQFEILREISNLGYGGSMAVSLFSGTSQRERAQGILNKEDAAQNAEYTRRIEELKRRGLQGDDQYAPGKGSHQKSDLERLEQRVKRARFEIQALQDLGSKSFKLRFELEGLEKVKSGFETIFKLRNEMGLILDQPVPQFRVFGTSEEQREDLANIQSYIQQMERMKTVFDGVRKVANEQGDALADLARVQQEALMPVVDAGILAEIKYQIAIRDRAKAEKELTADVISETKLRKDAIEDEVGSTLKAYMTLQRDLGRSQDTIRNQRSQDDLFVKLIKGDIGTEQDIRNSIDKRIGDVKTPIVPTELITIAAHAATIDLNVASIAEKIGANVHNTSTSNISSQASQTGYATEKMVVRNPDGSVTVVSQRDLNDTGDDTVKTQTTDPGYLRKRIFDESRQRAGGERSAAVRKANQDIIDNQMRMEQSLISLDDDYLDHYTTQQLARRAAARDTTISIMLLANDLKDLNDTNSELYVRTWAEADKSRLEGYRTLKDSIISLQNDIANNGFDQADRESKAHLQAIRDVQEASNQARESIIYNQVKIADATIYHAEIADAKVTEFLANQRSITDVIADAKIGVIDGTFNAIDNALDKFTSKLGIAGGLVKDLLSGFIRLALSPFFKAMYGGGGNAGGGGGGGIFGGFPGLPGGGGGGGIFGGGTPPFSGGAGFMSLLGGGGGGLSGVGSASSPGSIGSGTLSSIISRGLGIGVGGAPIGPASSGLSFGALAGGLAPILPLLGAGLGAQAGGSSRFGSILGGIGGLAGGLFGAAALSGSFALGAGSAFTSLGLGGVGAAFSFLGPLALTGIGAAIAVPLIIGALLLSRNSKRKEEEKKRNQATIDTRAALYDILAKVQTDQMDGSSARSAIEDLHQKWIEFGNSLKDRKTREHHMATWDHFRPIIDAINTAADQQLERENIRKRMIPVFGAGGYSKETSLAKLRPGEGIHYPGTNAVYPVSGVDKGYDTEFMYLPKGARVLSRQEMALATPMQHGGIMGNSSSLNELPELHIDNLELNIDADGLANIVISSRHFKTATIQNVKLGKKEKKL